MARRPIAQGSDQKGPQAGLRSGSGEVTVVLVAAPVELLTVPPDARGWSDRAAWPDDYDAVAPGTIVRLRPPHEARTNPALVRDAREHFESRGGRVRVELARPGPAVTAPGQPSPLRVPHRAVVESVLADARSADPDALRAVVTGAMDEEGL